MIARLQKSMKEKDQGFTLIELLVVMIIIGILAAIAIPVFMNQRKKAAETSAKADVSTIGKEIAAYYVDGTAALTLSTTSGVWTLTDGATPAYSTTGKLSGSNTTLTPTAITSFSAFCVAVDPSGSVTGAAKWSYGPDGLKKGGTC